MAVAHRAPGADDGHEVARGVMALMIDDDSGGAAQAAGLMAGGVPLAVKSPVTVR